MAGRPLRRARSNPGSHLRDFRYVDQNAGSMRAELPNEADVDWWIDLPPHPGEIVKRESPASVRRSGGVWYIVNYYGVWSDFTTPSKAEAIREARAMIANGDTIDRKGATVRARRSNPRAPAGMRIRYRTGGTDYTTEPVVRVIKPASPFGATIYVTESGKRIEQGTIERAKGGRRREREVVQANPRSIRLPGLIAYPATGRRPKETLVAHVTPREYSILKTFSPNDRMLVLLNMGFNIKYNETVRILGDA